MLKVIDLFIKNLKVFKQDIKNNSKNIENKCTMDQLFDSEFLKTEKSMIKKKEKDK